VKHAGHLDISTTAIFTASTPITSTSTGELTMSESTEFYRVTLSNGQVIELQKDDIDVLKKAVEDEEKSAEVTLPSDGANKMTIYIEHIVSIEASGLVRRGIGFIDADKRNH
jgi:hypothetical protein